MQHEIKTINQDVSARINSASAVASMSLPPPSAREKEGQEQKKFISNPEGIEDMFVTCDCLITEHVLRVAKVRATPNTQKTHPRQATNCLTEVCLKSSTVAHTSTATTVSTVICAVVSTSL